MERLGTGFDRQTRTSLNRLLIERKEMSKRVCEICEETFNGLDNLVEHLTDHLEEAEEEASRAQDALDKVQLPDVPTTKIGYV